MSKWISFVLTAIFTICLSVAAIAMGNSSAKADMTPTMDTGGGTGSTGTDGSTSGGTGGSMGSGSGTDTGTGGSMGSGTGSDSSSQGTGMEQGGAAGTGSEATKGGAAGESYATPMPDAKSNTLAAKHKKSKKMKKEHMMTPTPGM